MGEPAWKNNDAAHPRMRLQVAKARQQHTAPGFYCSLAVALAAGPLGNVDDDDARLVAAPLITFPAIGKPAEIP